MNNINAIQVKIGGKRRPPAPLPPLPPLPRRLLHTVRRAACRAFEPLPTPLLHTALQPRSEVTSGRAAVGLGRLLLGGGVGCDASRAPAAVLQVLG